MYKVLVVDDEIKIRKTIMDYLSAKGLNVKIAKNGMEAVEETELNDFDLIILDVMMPVMNGLDACKEIRKTHDTPILFLSALGEERDFLSGYTSGADDYIVKPFPLSILYEKCLAMIKRYKGTDKENRLTVSGITLDFNQNKAFVDGKEIELSQKDFQLLKYLIENKGIVLNRELILSRIWGWDFEGDERAVDTHIKIIRKALGDKARHIQTVFNAGYIFKEE